MPRVRQWLDAVARPRCAAHDAAVAVIDCLAAPRVLESELFAVRTANGVTLVPACRRIRSVVLRTDRSAVDFDRGLLGSYRAFSIRSLARAEVFGRWINGSRPE